MLVRVFYTSVRAPQVSTLDIERLLASARRRNRQLDLTGTLLVSADRFAQVLEGLDDAIDRTMQRILADGRHHSMVVLDRSTIKRRLFADFLASSRFDFDVSELLGRHRTPDEAVTTMASWTDRYGGTGQMFG